MGEPSVLHEDEGARQGDDSETDAAELASLRTILVGPEQRHLAALQARLDDTRARAEDLGEVLPQALLLHAQDPHFARALTPPIEKAITASVHRNPKPLADALFPVMGPAIRKAVAAGLAGMVESLNRTLEHSLSWRSVQWRLEGWRTGRSFAEIVLSKTLVYRVEQVFLIDRRSGLLLQHVHASAVETQDADLVSGMLTAIKDFVQDSFRVSSGGSLESLKVGDLSVWIEPGPYAIVAAVIRGVAPREFRQTLQDTLESIHLQFGEALEAFQGDVSLFTDARPQLEACLESQFRAGERKPRTRGAWLLSGAAAIALVVWAGFLYRDHRRWTEYLDLLRAQPGLVIVATGREHGHYALSGLRDPLARDPQSLLADARLTPADVVTHWAPYQALDLPLVLARATTILRPPDGTVLTLENGVLAAIGNPPLAWVGEAAKMAPLVAGVTRFDTAATLEPAIRTLASAIRAHTLLFAKGSAEFAPGSETVASVVTDVQQLLALGTMTGERFVLDVRGHTDAEGADEANVPLSLSRAEVVAAAIRTAVGPGIDVVAHGVGSAEPADPGQDESSNQRNRRVALSVTRERGSVKVEP